MKRNIVLITLAASTLFFQNCSQVKFATTDDVSSKVGDLNQINNDEPPAVSEEPPVVQDPPPVVNNPPAPTKSPVLSEDPPKEPTYVDNQCDLKFLDQPVSTSAEAVKWFGSPNDGSSPKSLSIIAALVNELGPVRAVDLNANVSQINHLSGLYDVIGQPNVPEHHANIVADSINQASAIAMTTCIAANRINYLNDIHSYFAFYGRKGRDGSRAQINHINADPNNSDSTADGATHSITLNNVDVNSAASLQAGAKFNNVHIQLLKGAAGDFYLTNTQIEQMDCTQAPRIHLMDAKSSVPQNATTLSTATNCKVTKDY